MIILKRLRKIREEKGITQDFMAGFVGRTRPTYTRWETGENEPDFDAPKKLANYFNVTTDYLLDSTDDPTPPNEKKPPITSLEAFRIYAREKLGHDPTQEELRDIDLATDIVIKRLENERKETL